MHVIFQYIIWAMWVGISIMSAIDGDMEKFNLFLVGFVLLGIGIQILQKVTETNKMVSNLRKN